MASYFDGGTEGDLGYVQSQDLWVGVTLYISRTLVLALERDHRTFTAELRALS